MERVNANMANMRISVRLAWVTFGSILSAAGLELFLVPHNMIIGGMTGASAIFSYLSEMRLGLFLFLLNLPFLLFRYRKLDAQTRLLTFAGLSILSHSAFFLHPAPAALDHTLASTAAGGVALGIGIGIVLRFGGFLDAADGLAMTSEAKTPGRIRRGYWIFNGSVLFAGGFVFGWDEAMYSVIAFLLAYRCSDFALSGFSLTRMVWITSESGEEIREALRSRYGKEVILLDNEETGRGKMMVCTVSRMEQASVIRFIRSLDPNCSLAFHAAHR